jgi:hypothetical protein
LESFFFTNQQWVAGVQRAHLVSMMYCNIAQSSLVEFVSMLKEIEGLGRASEQAWESVTGERWVMSLIAPCYSHRSAFACNVVLIVGDVKNEEGVE